MFAFVFCMWVGCYGCLLALGVRLCFACRFICSLLPLLKVFLAVAPGVAPYCGFGRCFVPIVWWAWLRQGSAGNGCKAALVSS